MRLFVRSAVASLVASATSLLRARASAERAAVSPEWASASLPWSRLTSLNVWLTRWAAAFAVAWARSASDAVCRQMPTKPTALSVTPKRKAAKGRTHATTFGWAERNRRRRDPRLPTSSRVTSVTSTITPFRPEDQRSATSRSAFDATPGRARPGQGRYRRQPARESAEPARAARVGHRFLAAFALGVRARGRASHDRHSTQG